MKMKISRRNMLRILTKSKQPNNEQHKLEWDITSTLGQIIAFLNSQTVTLALLIVQAHYVSRYSIFSSHECTRNFFSFWTETHYVTVPISSRRSSLFLWMTVLKNELFLSWNKIDVVTVCFGPWTIAWNFDVWLSASVTSRSERICHVALCLWAERVTRYCNTIQFYQ